jgi:hypothetical protein
MSEQKLGFRKTGSGQQLGVIVPGGGPEGVPAPSPSPTTSSPDPTSKPRPASGGSTGSER